ncbi:DNA-binding transcriptional regulator, AcrR family [Nonomuraea solani]|uniref:DNA-binding transcriptional regulator, AcrR family n=1 Tax=Nonomuraea solani TaxID=1144553 RepID=A0A1H5Y288_9ACTN|nr:DNA-binding transcriptional regulator, AcrR family [Nonomuraea solani]
MVGIALPERERLPAGPARDLVEALHRLYQGAGMPGVRRIAGAVVDGDFADTVSHEKVAAMLRGSGLPRWSKLEPVVRVLAAWNNPPLDPDRQTAAFQALWRAAATRSPGRRRIVIPSDGNDRRKMELLNAVVTYMLEQGSAAATLRDLSRAAGSNNRMLLYYFGSKENLVREALDVALLRYPLVKDADRHIARLDIPLKARLDETWRALCREENLPFLRLLFESVGLAVHQPGRIPGLLRHFGHDWVDTATDALVKDGLPDGPARLLAKEIVALWRGLQLDLLTTGDMEEATAVHDVAAAAIAGRAELLRGRTSCIESNGSSALQ